MNRHDELITALNGIREELIRIGEIIQDNAPRTKERRNEESERVKPLGSIQFPRVLTGEGTHDTRQSKHRLF